MSNYECRFCKDEGFVECDDCYKGEIICPECRNKYVYDDEGNRVDCENCRGTGYVECVTCDGTGKIECRKC